MNPNPDDKVVLPTRACTCCVLQLSKAASLIREAFDALAEGTANNLRGRLALVALPALPGAKVTTEILTWTTRVPPAAVPLTVLAGGLTIADLAQELGGVRAQGAALEIVGESIGRLQDRMLRKGTSDCIECMRRQALPQDAERSKVSSTYWKRQ